MRGLWIEDGTLEFRSNLSLEPRANECRVQVRRAGVCSTDLALHRGYMGFRGIPGHEFVGVALDGPLKGQRVVGEINAGCGSCDRCKRGLERHCASRTVLGIFQRHGCFAEQLQLPLQNLLVVPDALTDDAAVFTEPLAAAFEISEQVPLSPGMQAVVVGDGRLGLLCAHVLAKHGVEVTLAGRHPERAERLSGVRHLSGLFEAESPDGDSSYDLAVEATGDPTVLPRLFTHVCPRGTIVLKTTSEQPATIDFAPAVIDELTIVGSRCGRFEPALAELAAGTLDVESMVDDRFPLESGARAFERASEPGVLKVLIDVE